MSQIYTKVIEIKHCDSLHIVKFSFEDITLSMMSLELKKNVQVGSEVLLQVKPSHVAIGKNISGDLSYSNQIKSKIVSIENGQLLSSIKLEIAHHIIIESIITLNSSLRMNLQVGDEVIAFIKASELSIAKVLS